MRVPDHPVARALASQLGYPVTATSANRSGAAPATTASAVVAALGPGVALVLDDGPSASPAPSTIVDARGETPALVRRGAVAWDRVLESRQ